VQVRVYRQNESQPFFTQAVDLSDPTPVVRVPRSLLRNGRDRYRVVINNGAGDTAFSSTLDPVTEALVATYNENYRLTSAYYDAPAGQLYLFTSGLPYSGVLDRAKLRLEKDGNSLTLGTGEVAVTGSSPVVLAVDNLNPDVWSGAVYLRADAGWYTDQAGLTVAKEFSSVPVKPMAVLTGGSLDLTSKRLYLEGAGLTQGTIQWGLVQIRTGDADGVALRPGYDQITYLSDTQVIITLSDVTYTALRGQTGPSRYIATSPGWIQTSSGSLLARGGAVTGTHHKVMLRVLVTDAQYANGSLTLRSAGGLLGLRLDPTKLVFVASPGGTPVYLTNTPVMEATDDGAIAITLDPADAQTLEAAFGGANAYMNTLPGWLTNAQGQEVQPLPDHSVLFFVKGQ